MQQSGLNNMKLLQQHMMFKQLQEFQWQQFNGSGFNDPRSFNNDSQMSMNWVQRGTSQGHGMQETCSMSPDPPQIDVSLYGAYVTGGRSDMSPCLGLHQQSVYLMAKSDSYKDQNITTQSLGVKSRFSNNLSQDHSFVPQGLHEKTLLMSGLVLGLKSDPVPVQDQEDLSGMQQKPRQSSLGSVPLDPIEERILYHMDDNIGDSSFSRNNLEISSGGFSWSALMQSALAEDTGSLDGNSNNQKPNIHSFGPSLENVCGNSSGMLQHVQSHEDRRGGDACMNSCSVLPNSSCIVPGQVSSEMNQNSVALQSSVHLMPSLLDLSQSQHCTNKPDIPGEAKMISAGYVQEQTHMQVICDSSSASQPRDLSLRSNDLCMNAPTGQHKLVGVSNKLPITLPVIQQRPSEVYNGEMYALSEGIFPSVSYFPKSSNNIHQNSAILQQLQHNNLTLECLKTDNAPNAHEIACAEGYKLHEQNSRMKMPTNNEPGTISNLKVVASAEKKTPSFVAEMREDQTGKTLCLHSSSQMPNGLVPVSETRSDFHDVVTGHSSQLSVGKSLDNLQMQNYTEKLCITTWQSNIGPCKSATQMQYLETVDQSTVALRPKKRKSTAYGLWPWHKEVVQGSDRYHSISMSEQEWALATNRLFEKMEDKVGAIEQIPPSKRRLISTAQFMQQLLRLAPAFTFPGNSVIHYENVLYLLSRIALGDACSLTCYRRNSLLSDLDKSKTISEKIETFKTAGYQQYSEIVKAFIEKMQKLESDFQRLEKATSGVDIRVEIQDLERFSVINRFARFHSRAQANSSGHSSSYVMSKSVPQRYVIALPLPRTLPEGVHCLSL